MKSSFKQLGLAAAVAAVSAGYGASVSAQSAEYAGNFLGDMAVVPYYTTQGDLVTGIHIINTSASTQVVKLRMRRGTDSMDAMDFNLIMSPYDEWTGSIDDSTGNIVLSTQDNTCTAPLRADGQYEMPPVYREGAEEGYIEVIGMGKTVTEEMPIAIGAEHGSDGVPADCVAVESNFFRVATTAPVAFDSEGPNGILSSSLSAQVCTDAIAGEIYGFGYAGCANEGDAVLENNYESAGNALKVSFFVRDAASGLEFGSNAVHLSDFSDVAMMSNQEPVVIGEADAYGYLFPDMDGGSPVDTPRGRFEDVRASLGVEAIVNDWSVAAARNVSTDWVVTLPGQYTMLDLAQYTSSLFDEDEECLTQEEAAAADPVERACDSRDLPVEVTIDFWDREEQETTPSQGGLVISPALTLTPDTTLLPYEVNIIEWTAGESSPVLGSANSQVFDVSALGAEFGWASLSVKSYALKTQGVFNFRTASTDLVPFTELTNEAVPIVGFVAWERSFPEDPSANYGRMIDHSYQTSAE